MGFSHTDSRLRNLPDHRPAPDEPKALVDMRSLQSGIPRLVTHQHRLQAGPVHDVTLTDGQMHPGSYGGPVESLFHNRVVFTAAPVFGDFVLPAVVPVSEIDVVTNPG